MEERKEGQPAPTPVVAEDRPLDPALLPEGDPDIEIESLIIPALEELHTDHIKEARSRNGDAGNGAA